MMLVLRSQFFDFLRETFYRHALEYLAPVRSENKWGKKRFFLGKRLTIVTFLKTCGWSVHGFAAGANPRSST